MIIVIFIDLMCKKYVMVIGHELNVEEPQMSTTYHLIMTLIYWLMNLVSTLMIRSRKLETVSL